MKKIVSLVLIISIVGMLRGEGLGFGKEGITNPTLAQLRHQRECMDFAGFLLEFGIGVTIFGSIYVYKLLQYIRFQEEKLEIKDK